MGWQVIQFTDRMLLLTSIQRAPLNILQLSSALGPFYISCLRKVSQLGRTELLNSKYELGEKVDINLFGHTAQNKVHTASASAAVSAVSSIAAAAAAALTAASVSVSASAHVINQKNK